MKKSNKDFLTCHYDTDPVLSIHTLQIENVIVSGYTENVGMPLNMDLCVPKFQTAHAI